MAHPKMVTTTFVLLGLLGTARGFAAETAETSTSNAASSPAPVAGRLGPSDAARLFSGQMPSLDHVARKYAKDRPIDICTSKFNKLAGKTVQPKPVRANHATILARAKTMGLSAKKINKALAAFLHNQDRLPNQNYVTVIDFDRPASQKRLFTIDLRTGAIDAFHTSAGRGSDPDGDGYATMFSNRDNTHATSLGCYTAYGFYDGTNGPSMVLHGMESSNDNACDRSIVMHSANYVGGGRARSWGCPAVRETDREELFRRIGGGVICAEREGRWTTASKVYSSKKHGRRTKKYRRSKWRKKHSSQKYWRRHAAY